MSSFFKFKLTDGLYEHDFNLIKNTLNSYIIFNNSDEKDNNKFHDYKDLNEIDFENESFCENKTRNSDISMPEIEQNHLFNDEKNTNNNVFINFIFKNHKYLFFSTSFYLLLKFTKIC